MAVLVMATLDTKGPEAAFVCDQLRACGVEPRLMDTGCLGTPSISADHPREDVFAAAGTTLTDMQAQGDRGEAITRAAEGAAALIEKYHRDGRVDGVLGLGGSAGTTIATAAMRTLPLGVPKLMVSTLASGQMRPYVGGKDIMVLNPVVDIAGLNRISRAVLAEAARAMAGMIRFADSGEPGDAADAEDRPLVAATMFGVTTPCVQHARRILEDAGYEVLIFHATGNGGEAMEGLIADGLISGVLDITTTELADELVGGVLSAGPTRLTAAAQRGIPQVISVGALDMVNFGGTPPAEFSDRLFYRHNPTVTLMRTTPEECAALGREIAEKAGRSRGPVSVLLPLRGVSAIDQEGQPFDDPAAREALFTALRENRGNVELIEADCHINDEAFAEQAARRLLELMQQQQSG